MSTRAVRTAAPATHAEGGHRVRPEQAEVGRGEGKACALYVSTSAATFCLVMRRTAPAKTSPSAAAANASSVEVCWMPAITAAFLARRCFGIASAKKCAESCESRTSVTNPANTSETARSGLRLRAIPLNSPPLDLRYLSVLQVDDPSTLSRSRRSCVAIKTVLLLSRLSSTRVSMTSVPLLWSKFPVGSSASITGASPTIPRAIAARWSSPPESSEGNLPALSARPTLAIDSRILFGLFVRREVSWDEGDHDVLEHGQVADQEELLKHDAHGLVPELLQVLLPER